MSEWLERARARTMAPPQPARRFVPAAPPLPPPPPPIPELVQMRAPESWLQRIRYAASERAMANDGQVMGASDSDLLRILSLPYLSLDAPRCPDRAGYAASLYSHIKPEGFALRDVQIDGAYTYEKCGGMLGIITVGGGKTGLAMLCAKVALERRGHHRAVILVPPEVYSQLTLRDLPWMRQRLSLDALPIYQVAGTKEQRRKIVETQGPGVFIYTYSSLSAQTGYDELAAICPTCIILDEAQNLARYTAARTKRWHSIVNAISKGLKERRLGPDVKAKEVEVVLMSGTITKKSVKDYAHLARVALHELSPAPIKEQAITLFSGFVDADVHGTGNSDRDFERMQELVGWAYAVGLDPTAKSRAKGVEPTFQETVREAYQHRLRSTSGVVSTVGTGVDCSLIISWAEAPRPSSEDANLQANLMKQVVVDMLTPNKDVIDFGMHMFKWLWELSAGFYNSLVWPTEDEVKASFARTGRPITNEESQMLLQRSFQHHALLQDYHKLLRAFLDGKHIPGCDTPMLVAQELTKQIEAHEAGQKREARFKVPHELIEAYAKQRTARYDDLPQRRSIPIRVCDYKIRAAVEWCRAHVGKEAGGDEGAGMGGGGIVWFHHPEIGRWLHEMLVEAGIKHTMAFAGMNEEAFTTGLVIASYAHGTGKNLQHQSRNLILELRREAATMEQTLGRTHRSGQMADDVRVDMLICNGFDLTLFNAILRDSDYIQATTGQQQRLCYATYAPVIPPTHPRLAVRLGIIESTDVVDRISVEPHASITPPEALDIGDIFRSMRFASGESEN